MFWSSNSHLDVRSDIVYKLNNVEDMTELYYEIVANNTLFLQDTVLQHSDNSHLASIANQPRQMIS